MGTIRGNKVVAVLGISLAIYLFGWLACYLAWRSGERPEPPRAARLPAEPARSPRSAPEKPAPGPPPAAGIARPSEPADPGRAESPEAPAGPVPPGGCGFGSPGQGADARRGLNRVGTWWRASAPPPRVKRGFNRRSLKGIHSRFPDRSTPWIPFRDLPFQPRLSRGGGEGALNISRGFKAFLPGALALPRSSE